MAYEDIGYRLSLVMLEVQLPENRGRQRTEFRHSTFTSGLTLSIFAFGLTIRRLHVVEWLNPS